MKYSERDSWEAAERASVARRAGHLLTVTHCQGTDPSPLAAALEPRGPQLTWQAEREAGVGRFVESTNLAAGVVMLAAAEAMVTWPIYRAAIMAMANNADLMAAGLGYDKATRSYVPAGRVACICGMPGDSNDCRSLGCDPACPAC